MLSKHVVKYQLVQSSTPKLRLFVGIRFMAVLGLDETPKEPRLPPGSRLGFASHACNGLQFAKHLDSIINRWTQGE